MEKSEQKRDAIVAKQAAREIVELAERRLAGKDQPIRKRHVKWTPSRSVPGKTIG
jgi:hypothetical protein